MCFGFNNCLYIAKLPSDKEVNRHFEKSKNKYTDADYKKMVFHYEKVFETSDVDLFIIADEGWTVDDVCTTQHNPTHPLLQPLIVGAFFCCSLIEKYLNYVMQYMKRVPL